MISSLPPSSYLRLRLPPLAAALLAAASFSAPAKELDGVYSAAATPCPTVEEALAKMKVPDGYEVRCFASEPMVINPVAMCWDHRGRLWVVELYEYPTGAPRPNEYSKTATDENFRPVVKSGPGSPRDRVIVLEDTDNDGKADRRTVFADGLNLATAITCGHGGVFVGQAPNLFFFRDTDGDDRADEYKAVLTGFGLEDRHELLNSFTWGPDGHLYFTHGVFTHSKVRRPGEGSGSGNVLNAGVYRVKFRTDAEKGPSVTWHEVYADGTSNPWGVDFDTRGNAFVEACVIDHLFHMAPGGIYERQGGAPENPYAYELLPSIVPKDHPRHFRAAYAGITLYKGGIYPEDTRGHVFFGNIHDNAIHEEALEPVGATFRARNVRDILRANDGWFRPVSVQTGPDGFLWIMDWCDKYPCYQNAQANPAGVDREKGRIWRLCYTGSEEGKKLAGMSRAPGWVQPQPAEFSPAEAAGAAVSPDAGLRRRAALWAADPDRTSAKTDTAFPAWLPALAADPDPSVRQAAAVAARCQGRGGRLTVGSAEAAGPSILPLLEALVKSSANADRTLAFSIWMALESEVALMPETYLPWLAAIAPHTKPLSQNLVRKSARRLTDTRSAENMDRLLGFLDQIKTDATLTAHALEGMLKAQEAGALKPASFDPAPLFSHWKASPSDQVKNLSGRLATLWGDPNAVAALMGTVLDAGADPARRIEAIRTVRRLKSDAARAGVLQLLGSQTPDDLTLETLRAAGELGGLDLANAILKAWAGYPGPVRTAAAEVLAARNDWATRLLDAVEGKWIASGKIAPADIPVSIRRSLALNPELRERAAALLGAWNESGEDIKALIAAKRQACIEGEPDMALGKVLFEATCATCHKFHGGGHEVGPELIGSGRSNLDAILANVIDPNQIIGNGYQNFIITTRDGRTLAGRVIEDTPTQVTLLGIGGSREVVPAGEILKKEDTGLSLMPMGFGSLPDDQFRSLIWYILAPPDEGPLTPEKKAALIKGAEAEARAASDPPAKTEAASGNGPAIDWESVSLWNPEWKVTAPEFEGTPVKLPEYAGRKNVLRLHPFPDKKSPAILSRPLPVPDTAKPLLKFATASTEGHDWDLVVRVDGREIKRARVGSSGSAGPVDWTLHTIDLAPWRGRTVPVELENHPSGWAWEFSYWSGLELVP